MGAATEQAAAPGLPVARERVMTTT